MVGKNANRGNSGAIDPKLIADVELRVLSDSDPEIFLKGAVEKLREDVSQFDFLVWDAFNREYPNPQALQAKLIEISKRIIGPDGADDFDIPAGDTVRGMTPDEIFQGRAMRILYRDPARIDDLVEEAFRKGLRQAPMVTARLQAWAKNVRETSGE